MEQSEFVDIFTRIINACKDGRISRHRAKVEIRKLLSLRDRNIVWVEKRVRIKEEVEAESEIKQKRKYFSSHLKPEAKLRGDFRPWKGKK